MISFQNPQAFFLLLFIPLIFILRKLKIFSRISFVITLSDWAGESFKWNTKVRKFASVFSAIAVGAGFITAVTALAKPVSYKQERVYTSRGTDIIFVLDVSPSMAAKDVLVGNSSGSKKTRIEAAKESIKTLVEANGGVCFGLIGMGGEAAVVVPPTIDHKLFLKRLEELQIGKFGDGTAIGIGLTTAFYHLVSSKAPKKCVVLVTDGENNAGSIHPETAAELAGKKDITLYTMGLGTAGKSSLEYTDPKTGKKVSGSFSSTFNSAQLKNLANLGNGRYFESTTLNDLSLALSVISKNENEIQTYHAKITSIEYYHIFVLISLISFAIAWVIRRLYLQELI